MRTIFKHPKQLFILTLLNSNLTGIRAEDNAYSIKIGIKTEKSFKLPFSMNIEGFGKIILETVNSKENRGGTEVPASTEFAKNGKKDYTSTVVMARAIPSTTAAYFLIINAQIAGIVERMAYEASKSNATTPSAATIDALLGLNSAVPAMQSPKGIQLTADDLTPAPGSQAELDASRDEDMPF